MAKTLSIIVVIAADYGIGYKNELLTHISEDLKRFKKITAGHPVIMGRNTWFSLPKRPLPNRKNIVITNEDEKFDNATTVYSIEEALQNCPENEESFVIGGAMIYKQFFTHAHKLYITKIKHTFPADTFFPEILEKDWSIESESEIYSVESSDLKYQYINYIKK